MTTQTTTEGENWNDRTEEERKEAIESAGRLNLESFEWNDYNRGEVHGWTRSERKARKERERRASDEYTVTNEELETLCDTLFTYECEKARPAQYLDVSRIRRALRELKHETGGTPLTENMILEEAGVERESAEKIFERMQDWKFTREEQKEVFSKEVWANGTPPIAKVVVELARALHHEK